MAYTKVGWTAREGVNLNKYTKASETTSSVILTNTPDDITVAGTPFSAANMEQMDQGIKDNSDALDAIIHPFTFVVNDNASLVEWATNASGNDYAVVMIKGDIVAASGPSYTVENSNTKFVYGVGARVSGVIFTGFRMQNVTVYDNGPNAAFIDCDYSVGCVVEGTDCASGFSSCDCLSGCKVSTTTATYVNVYGFVGCNYLSKCCANVTTTVAASTAIGFYNCNYATACYSYASAVTSAGYDVCTSVVACNGQVFSSTATAIAFSNSSVIIGCTGSGVSTSSSGYGFVSCNGVTSCRKSSVSSTTSTFNTPSVCASQGTYNATYAAANTPAGGFNDLT